MARPGPRSKLCRQGRHDWHHDGWCQRAGCLATRTEDLFGVRLDDPDDLGPGAGGQLDLFAADRERDPWGREQGGLFSNPIPDDDPGMRALVLQSDVWAGDITPEQAESELPALEVAAAGNDSAAREVRWLRRELERAKAIRAQQAQLAGKRSAHLRARRGQWEVMIHPSVRPDATPGSWQVTRFGPGRPGEGMVPYGHHNEASMDAALAEAWRDYGPLDVIAANPPPLARAAEVYVSPRARPLTEREAFVRQVSIDLKHGDPAAVEIAARAMAPLVPRGAVLVPVPSSKAGQVGGNEPLALRLAELTGGRALRLVERVVPVESSRERRRAGGQGLAPSAHAATMRAVGRTPRRRPVVLVDNVVVTGATMEGARRALGLRRSEVLGVAYSSAEAPEQPAEARLLRRRMA